MSAASPSGDLLDLKLLPAWATEEAQPTDYSKVTGEEEFGSERDARGSNRGGERQSRAPRVRGPRRDRQEREKSPRRDQDRAPREDHRPHEAPASMPAVGVLFLPHAPALESVTAQIKSGTVAYSVFALARLFLEKPERYDVRLTASAEALLFRIGESGAVATDRRILENGAFASSLEDFYEVETTQMEPLKGNFTNVARCRLSGTLLGPTNHHNYQPQLRNLYEQRFSRRMSFADYQKQIEISSDPAVVEQWKEQARNVTKYRTKSAEPQLTFSSFAEAERHFRQNHLPDLIRAALEFTVDGVTSRRLQDRGLGHAIEAAWAHETRSPSKMMQELAGALRNAGLNIFRHRRGMLFVSPIRMRAFGHTGAGVSSSVNSIFEKVAATPGINRKKLAEQIAPVGAADHERAKLTLASDLRWLISEGYVIEFNDGSLDLPRTKAPVETKPMASNNTVTDPSAEAPTAAQPAEISPGEAMSAPAEDAGLIAEAAGETVAEPDQSPTTSRAGAAVSPS